jgi:hypothetical protein
MRVTVLCVLPLRQGRSGYRSATADRATLSKNRILHAGDRVCLDDFPADATEQEQLGIKVIAHDKPS